MINLRTVNQQFPKYSLSYYTIYNRMSDNNGNSVQQGPTISLPNLPVISPLVGTKNPIFNFSPNFIQKLNNIAPNDLATAVPFISLKLLDNQGNLLRDFSLSLFGKPIDMTSVSSPARFSDRPEMSLKSVEVTTDNPSGYLFYERVKLVLKLHRPDMITNKSLIGLLLPGLIIELEYGWNSNASNSDLLNQHDTLYFSVVNYNISFDMTGQADLNIDGMVFQDKINNFIIGDGQFIVPDNALPTGERLAKTEGKQLVSSVTLDGITNAKQSVENYKEYMQNNRGDTVSINTKVIKSQVQEFESLQKKVRGEVKARFRQLKNNLWSTSAVDPSLFKEQTKKKKDRNGNLVQVSGEYFTFHSIVHHLISPTISEFKDSILNNADFRVVYGSFNNRCGALSNTCLGLFKIRKSAFHKFISEQSSGDQVPSLKGVINEIIESFFNNRDYWNKQCTNLNEVVYPHVIYHITTFKEQGRKIFQIAFVDINKDIPPTTTSLPDDRNVSEQEMEASITRNAMMPIIRLGHINSFIKNISLTNYDDQNIKAFLINKANESSLKSYRYPLTKAETFEEYVKKSPPLFLPLKGEMTVLGSSEWRPFRFFYLDTGIFFMNGVYKILSVSHSLSAEGFYTKISFMYH